MTLSAWKKKYGHPIRPYGLGKLFHAFADLREEDRKAYADLFHLSDYLVSGVRAGAVVLAPRPKGRRKASNPHKSGLSIGEQLTREIKKARKRGDEEAEAYYLSQFGSSAFVSWDKFKNSWAGEQWRAARGRHMKRKASWNPRRSKRRYRKNFGLNYDATTLPKRLWRKKVPHHVLVAHFKAAIKARKAKANRKRSRR